MENDEMTFFVLDVKIEMRCNLVEVMEKIEKDVF